jgi:hypothetical protein
MGHGSRCGAATFWPGDLPASPNQVHFRTYPFAHAEREAAAPSKPSFPVMTAMPPQPHSTTESSANRFGPERWPSYFLKVPASFCAAPYGETM